MAEMKKTVKFEIDGETVAVEVAVEFRGQLDPPLGQKYCTRQAELRQMLERVRRGLDPGTLVFYPVENAQES